LETRAEFIESCQPAINVRSYFLYRVCCFFDGASLPDLIIGSSNHYIGKTHVSAFGNILECAAFYSVFWLFFKIMEGQIIGNPGSYFLFVIMDIPEYSFSFSLFDIKPRARGRFLYHVRVRMSLKNSK
jgi:hypothetical protein